MEYDQYSPRMDTFAPAGLGFPGNINKGDHASQSLPSGVYAAAVPPLILKTGFWSFKAAFSGCIMLIFATIFFRTTSAQSNFSIPGTSYNCSSNIICLGDAHVYTGNETDGIRSGRLSLLQETMFLKKGIAYYHKPVRFLDPIANESASFSTSFTIDNQILEINGSYTLGDGMTFVISADNSSLGDDGANFGFLYNDGGIMPFKSIVVEFDTFMNNWSPFYDISNNHVSFDFANITWAAAANASDVNVALTDQQTVYAWVDYSRDTQQLEVRISHTNFRPTSPLLNFTVNLFDVVDEYMWVGFSSGAGDFQTNFYIGDWTFESYGILEPSVVPISSPASSPVPISGKSGGSKLAVIMGISLGIPAILLCCLAMAPLVRRGSGGTAQRGWRDITKEDSLMQLGMPKIFTYKQLSFATNAFSETSKLGRGGFGSVYRGELPSSGMPVAVKKISGESTQGEKEFMAEVSIISQLRHRNLIQLLGWCKDAAKQKYLLVYELMPNASLDKVLFRPADSQTPCLSWPQRFNILTGTAAAIDYLHQGWMLQVIHRDIKSSNIMLDEEWNAKLGDFGLARLVDHRREAATTMVAGTFGYLAPEVAASGKFTDKTDVFAFGAVVLEVACGRKALDNTQFPEDENILVDWVWNRLSEGDLLSTVDKQLVEYDSYWMEVVLTVGLLCSHPNPQARPSMRHVVQVLAGDIPVPSIPSYKPNSVFGSDRYGAATDFSSLSKSGSTSKSRSGSISQVTMNTSDSTRASTFGTSSNSSSSLRKHSCSGGYIIDFAP